VPQHLVELRQERGVPARQQADQAELVEAEVAVCGNVRLRVRNVAVGLLQLRGVGPQVSRYDVEAHGRPA